MGRVFVARLTLNPKMPPEALLRRLIGASLGPIKIQSIVVPPTLTSEFFLLIVAKTDRADAVGKKYSFGAENFIHIISVKTLVGVAPGWREIK